MPLFDAPQTLKLKKPTPMIKTSDFFRQIRQEYDGFLRSQQQCFPSEETLKIDLHCHDYNSDVPDELWGRLLNLPETWLPTEQLAQTLSRNGADVITVTNHNNARSCWALKDKGEDILVGTEFTCHFPDSTLSIHVLTYGFTPTQEQQLNTLRHDIFDFVRFTRQHNLVTVLPHPLFFYTHDQKPDLSILEKFAVLFQRFEVLNGQRGYWQNLLTLRWVESLTPERIDYYAKKHQLDPFEFCENPYQKSMTGGSDDHNGIFAGRTGTLVHIPDLANRLKHTSRATLVLDAIREGRTAPYGELGEEEKLTVTFLDYFSQVAIHMQDPGLLRMMLHKGSLQDKLMCLGVSNAMQELKRHKYTLTFLKTFHESLSGTKPALLTSLGVSKEFKPALKVIKQIAKTQRKHPERFLETIREAIPELYQVVTHIFFDRLNQHLEKMDKGHLAELTTDELVRRFEIPTQFRALFSAEKSVAPKDITQLNLSKMLDELTFPALASGVVMGAAFTASQVIYNNREFLNELADTLGKEQHPQKALWLTDTFADHNGVSSVLQSTLIEIQNHDYPIDILTCHPDLAPQDHLVVVRPVSSFKVQSLGQQAFYIPDILELQRIFEQGGYDRIICSTELLMGAIALYLKKAFSVPAYFFMHTDWMEFIQRTTQLNHHESDRIRRLLRAFYAQFEGIFTLNKEHQAWLTSPEMDIPEANVKLTQHWADNVFTEQKPDLLTLNRHPILLYVGRLSEEKGVYDLIDVYQTVKRNNPQAELWFAGTGPAEVQLKAQLPDAHFLGWVDKKDLPALYQKTDLLLLPSRFDTFGCVVLEALSCGLPVVAYNCKGPKDIIEHNVSGYLVDNSEAMASTINQHLQNTDKHQTMRQAAYAQSQTYSSERIMHSFMADIKLTG